MAKYVNKTQPTQASVEDFIRNYPNPKIIDDSVQLLQIFKEITEKEPVLWGSKVGFGTYHYQGKSSAGEWFMTGFAPTKSGLTIYSMVGYDNVQELLAKLGKYKTSSSCLYIPSLAAVDQEALKGIISTTYQEMVDKYGKGE
ncbi:MAG: hypothetical protein OHK0017_05640 [Patescibacteria group bacterium]